MLLAGALHRPAPGRVGREGEHAAFAEFAGHQERPAIGRDRQRLGGGHEPAKVVGTFERRHRPPGRERLLIGLAQPQDRHAAKLPLGKHLQRARNVEALPHGLVEGLPREAIRLEGHERRERRTPPAARLEGMKSTEQADSRARLHAAEDELEILRSERRRIEVADQEDVVVTRRQAAEIDRPAVAAARVDPLEVNLHVGARGEHAPEKPLLHPQSSLEIEHTQAAIDHVDERGELVVGHDGLPLLRLHDERYLPFAELAVGSPRQPHGLLHRLRPALHAGAGHLLHSAGVVLGEEFHDHISVGEAIEPHAAGHLEGVAAIDGLAHHEIRHRRVAALPRAPLLAERDAPERHPRIPDLAGSRLRRQVAWRIGVLGSVAEHDDPGEMLSGGRPEGVFDRGADRTLVGRRLVLPVAQWQRFVGSGGHNAGLAVESPDGDVEVAIGHERPCRRPRRGQRGSQFLPAGAAIGAVGDAHALRSVGQHEHAPVLPRPATGDDRRPQHAGHEREKRAQPEEHEHEPACGRQTRAIGADREEHGGQRQRDDPQQPPRSHRVEVQRRIVQQARGDHEGVSASIAGTASASRGA